MDQWEWNEDTFSLANKEATNKLTIWSGGEDCSTSSVWCKTTQRRHRSNDHLTSYWWDFPFFSFFSLSFSPTIEKVFLSHNIVFLCRPAASICVSCLLPILPRAVWSCLQQRHRSKVLSFPSSPQLSQSFSRAQFFLLYVLVSCATVKL